VSFFRKMRETPRKIHGHLEEREADPGSPGEPPYGTIGRDV
jgi:hypothetical protein